MPSSYQRRAAEGARNAETVVAQVVSAFEEGILTADDLAMILPEVLDMAAAQGYSLGSASMVAYLDLDTGTPQPTRAAARKSEAPRLRKAVETILTSREGDFAMQLAQFTRLARNTVIDAAAKGQASEVERNRRVKGWRRELEADACELCQWWARDGRVWQSDHPMPRHKGCLCEQAPVTDASGANVQTQRQAERARESAAAREKRNA